MDSPAQPQVVSLAPLEDSRTGAGAERGAAVEPLETLRAELAALRAEFDRNDRQIDELRLQAAERTGPWYSNVQTLVAVFALLLSLVTATISGYWGWT